MAYASSSVSNSMLFGLKARLQMIRASLADRAERRAIYSRTVNELQSLSDRDLADLGFHRSEIPRIAQEAADQA